MFPIKWAKAKSIVFVSSFETDNEVLYGENSY